MMSLEETVEGMRAKIETALQEALAAVETPNTAELHGMLAYHLGWEGEGAGPRAQGKRIRPVLVTLTTAAAGGQWQKALPAAVAVELVHNFSLIHDDIQDNSPLRRGRPTVWKLWGIPQAINAGDFLFSLAQLRILDLRPAEIALEAGRLLGETCLQLTQGQYQDIAYESRRDLIEEAYWPMIGGKTAALIGACTEIGALVGRATAPQREAYRAFGRNLGLAFQVQDDLLGIWGDSDQTGKSNQSDLLEGKKSLPVVYGLQQGKDFARRWLEGPLRPEEVTKLAQQLAAEGAYDYAHARADQLTQEALGALQQAGPQNQAGLALQELALRLLRRQG